MSLIGQALDNWLQRQGASVMHQEVTACERFPEHTKEAMWDISVASTRSSFVEGVFWPDKLREKGAPITHDYTLGNVRTGTIDRVLIPRPEETIGTFHTHPMGHPFPSHTDTLEVMDKDDKVTCIGASGKAGTKIQCFTANKPKYSDIQYKFRLLDDDIKDFNKKVYSRWKKRGPELLELLKSEAPGEYEQYLSLKRRKDALIDEIREQLRQLAVPKEWTVLKRVDGFAEVPFFEANPNMFNKCRIMWETLEEELPFEL